MTQSKKKSQLPDNPLLLPATAASLHDSTPTRHTLHDGRAKFGVAATALALFMFFATGLSINTQAMISPIYASFNGAVSDHKTYEQLRKATKEVSALTTRQATQRLRVADTANLEQQLSIAQLDIEEGRPAKAQFELIQIQQRIDAARTKLDAAAQAQASAATTPFPADMRVNGLEIPILMYHYTPNDFDAQLSAIEQKGYHAVTMSQVAAALQGVSGLPAKAVAITFDDGFANQMEAFRLLQRHHMVATYYIISGGERSKWCIGTGRRYGDPLQPASGCGDTYLNWDQISTLDRSGVVSIGAHTVDHENLANEPADIQLFEILANKHDLETRLGHPIRDFAYPYGAFNTTSIQIVRDVGFSTAVTTLPGTSQTLDGIYTLRRIRDITQLP